jgi:hypothetical protein
MARVGGWAHFPPWHLLFVFVLVAIAAAPAAAETRFRTWALVIDSAGEPLAAWQVELACDPAAVKIVGVEGGPSPWAEAPHYDPKGLEAGKMVIAAFTLAPQPPAGATRVARVHVQESGWGETSIRAKLTAAADPAGRRIGATVRLVPEEGERP